MTEKDDVIAATSGVDSAVRSRRATRFNLNPDRTENAESWLWAGVPLPLKAAPTVLLQAVVTVSDKTEEGQVIQAVTAPWFKIIDLMQSDPEVIYELDWRKWEEIIAGAHKEFGFDVVLTPRSNDKGRDIIATSEGLLSIRYLDQVKAYKPGHLVTADDVRSMVGVLSLEPNVSKGIITTTSDFAPGVKSDPQIQNLVPNRLELRSKDDLLMWLKAARLGEPPKPTGKS